MPETSPIYYDPAVVPSPFVLDSVAGARDISVLLQCLCCCPAFTKQVLRHQEYMKKSRVGKSILNFVTRYINRSLDYPKDIRRFPSIILTNLMKDARQEDPDSDNHTDRSEQPETLADTLLLILSTIALASHDEATPMADVFTHRYNITCACAKCGGVTSSVGEYAYLINIDSLEQRPTTVEAFSDTIMHSVYTVSAADHYCESCKEPCDGIAQSVLTRSPEIIMYTFDIYNTSTPRECKNYYFPDRIICSVLDSCTQLEYRIVAQVEHFGADNGGHYITRTLHDGIVFCFDGGDSPSCGRFEPTEDTYMVIYHIVQP